MFGHMIQKKWNIPEYLILTTASQVVIVGLKTMRMFRNQRSQHRVASRTHRKEGMNKERDDDDRLSSLLHHNAMCYYALLKSTMFGLDGSIQTLTLPRCAEARWIHTRGGFRSICIDPFSTTFKGTRRRVIMTSEGVAA
jgi:hypothetical protein